MLSALQHQVDLGAVVGAVEVRAVSVAGALDQRFQRKAFVAGTGHGVAQQVVLGAQTQQRVDQAAIAHIDLGCAHQAFADVGVRR